MRLESKGDSSRKPRGKDINLLPESRIKKVKSQREKNKLLRRRE